MQLLPVSYSCKQLWFCFVILIRSTCSNLVFSFWIIWSMFTYHASHSWYAFPLRSPEYITDIPCGHNVTHFRWILKLRVASLLCVTWPPQLWKLAMWKWSFLCKFVNFLNLSGNINDVLMTVQLLASNLCECVMHRLIK